MPTLTSLRAVILDVRCGGGWSEQDLAGAVGVYDDPLDLLLNYDDSPLAPRRELLAAARTGRD